MYRIARPIVALYSRLAVGAFSAPSRSPFGGGFPAEFLPRGYYLRRLGRFRPAILPPPSFIATLPPDTVRNGYSSYRGLYSLR